jgi:hypothetical protein
VGWNAVDHDGKMYRIAEWYGCTGTPNTGLQIEPRQIAAGIKEKEETNEFLKGRKIEQAVADPAIFEHSTGPSIADVMEKERVYWERGDNTRLAGKMQYHYRMAFDEYGDTMFQVFNTCTDFIRCIPLLVYSDKHPEDIDTDMEDHNYDEQRYAFMLNPINARANSLTAIDLNDPLDQRVTARPRFYY